MPTVICIAVGFGCEISFEGIIGPTTELSDPICKIKDQIWTWHPRWHPHYDIKDILLWKLHNPLRMGRTHQEEKVFIEAIQSICFPHDSDGPLDGNDQVQLLTTAETVASGLGSLPPSRLHVIIVPSGFRGGRDVGSTPGTKRDPRLVSLWGNTERKHLVERPRLRDKSQRTQGGGTKRKRGELKAEADNIPKKPRTRAKMRKADPFGSVKSQKALKKAGYSLVPFRITITLTQISYLLLLWVDPPIFKSETHLTFNLRNIEEHPLTTRLAKSIKNDGQVFLKLLERHSSEPDISKYLNELKSHNNHTVPLLGVISLGPRSDRIMILPELRPLDSALCSWDCTQALGAIKSFPRQLLEAVQLMHDSGVVHRDLKSHNLLFGQHGTSLSRLIIADFGISAFIEKEGDLFDDSCGTVGWMAPEFENLSEEELYDPILADRGRVDAYWCTL